MVPRIVATACVVMIVVIRRIELGTGREVIPGRVLETRTLKLFLLNGYSSAALGLAELWWLGRTVYVAPFVLGLAVALSSFLIRRSAIRALGKYWSLNVEIRDNHPLITSGPFKYIRHPTYLSQILELLSFNLILCAYLPLILFVGLFVPTMFCRIRIEERALIDEMGERYRDYMRNVPALFPKLHRNRFRTACF